MKGYLGPKNITFMGWAGTKDTVKGVYIHPTEDLICMEYTHKGEPKPFIDGKENEYWSKEFVIAVVAAFPERKGGSNNTQQNQECSCPTLQLLHFGHYKDCKSFPKKKNWY